MTSTGSPAAWAWRTTSSSWPAVLARSTTLGCPSASQAAKSAVPRLARVAATAAWATWAAIFPRPISRSVLTTTASFTATVATISVADEELGGMLAQLGNGGDPQQPHRPLELLGQQIQGLVHARLAGGHQAVQVGAADRHRVGPERGGDGDVGAVPDAGVDQHRQIRADRLADPGQQVDGGDGAVELAPAVVGQLQAVDTGLDGPASVGGAERPLDDQLAGPLLP